jgi:hypothetical protein
VIGRPSVLVITLDDGERIELFSTIDFSVRWFVDTNWVAFHGEFDSFATRQSRVVEYRVRQIGDPTA